MEPSDLKFILQLLEFENYRTPLSEIKLSSTTSDTELEEICQKLCDRGFLVCSYKVKKFKIAPPGKFLLKQNIDKLPLTKQEIKVLQVSAKDTITPKDTDIPAEERQMVIQSLAARGLIEVKAKHKKIKEVWLSERGKEYLQYEYDPSTSCSDLGSDLLNNYLQFLRKSLLEVSPSVSRAAQTLSDEKILLTIRELERQLGANNRLPICHLREKLHPLLSREELDDALYRLQRSDKIELSALQPATACAFTSEEIDDGIPQDRSPPLFFVILK